MTEESVIDSPTKRIVETDYYSFVENLVSAVKQGYCVETSRRGMVNDVPGLKDITLYWNQGDGRIDKPLGEFTISTYNTQEFLQTLSDFVFAGGNVDMSTLSWDRIGTKSIQGKLYIKPEYNKDELLEMPWDDLKEVCYKLDITARDRVTMVARYLGATGQNA